MMAGMPSRCHVRVLGPLRVQVSGEDVQLGGPRPRLLFALLVVAGGRSVSMDRLIDDLYAADPPQTARKSIQVHVSNLRRALEPVEAILTTSDGYRLDTEVVDIDAMEFAAAVNDAVAGVDADPAKASRSLSHALRLWEGAPFADLGSESALRAEIASLNEQRLRAMEVRIEIELRLGRHADVLAELETLTRDHPYREELRALQMLALYRSNRQADALRVYDRSRALLVEELGLEPMAKLRDLYVAILKQDPTLDAPAATGGRDGDRPPSVMHLRGYELRGVIGRGPVGEVHRAYQASTGRETAIKIVGPELSNRLEFVRRFEAEAQFVARLSHPAIAPIDDHWRDPDGAYVVMPLLRGGSLADLLKNGPLEPPAAIRIIDQVGAALAYAHRHGVIHGNLKPENVLFDEHGHPFVTDFLFGGEGVPDGSTSDVRAAYAPPERLAGEPMDQRSDVYTLTLLLHETLTGERARLGESLSSFHQPGTETPSGLNEVLAVGSAKSPGDRYSRVEDLRRALRKAFGIDAVAPSPAGGGDELRNPFKGLRAFGETDAGDFHGRASTVELLTTALASSNVVVLVGPSGTGKSSVVKAGLIPAVRSGILGSETDWVIADMYPGAYPFEELEAALLGVAADRPDRLVDQLESDDRGLLRVSKQILGDDRTSLLLIVDQFEELFALVPSAITRDRFLANLVTIAADDRSRVKVVLTLRADFFDHPLQHPAFAGILERSLVTVSMPQEESLAMAISQPARAVGLEIEPGLIPAMIADVVGEPGGLPLLQYCLTELVEHRRGDVLSLSAYEELGRAGGAIARRAEQIYSGLSEAGQKAARHVFLRLVAVSTDSDDTRRRVGLGQLMSMAPDVSALEQVIDEFGAHRLLTFDHDPVTRGPTVEVAHEALIHRWPRYQAWIDERRGDLLSERRLESAAAEWEDQGRESSFLLRGERLEHYDSWATTTDLPLTEVMRDFLGASLVLANRLADEEAEQERRASALRRRSRLLVATGLGVITLAVVAIGGWMARGEAEEQRQSAEQQATQAEERAAEAAALTRDVTLFDEARRLAEEASAVLNEDPGLAVSLAVAGALVTSETGEVDPTVVDALHWALQDGGASFDTTASTPIATRPSPSGLRGVFLISVDELIDMAQDGQARQFTQSECQTHFAETECPDPTTAPPRGLEVAGGTSAYLAFTEASAPLTGTSVNLATWLPDSDDVGQPVADQFLLDALERATTGSGVTITHDQVDVLDEQLFERDDIDVDIVMTTERSFLSWAADRGEIHDLSDTLDPSEFGRRYGPQLTALVRPDGIARSDSFYALPVTLFTRSMVTYNREAFERRGYAVPQTWDELIALSDRAVADGETPWCWAGKWLEESGGFPVADWLAAMMLSEWGPEIAEAWARGDLPSTSPQVRQAFERLGTLTFTPGYSAMEPDRIPDIDFWQPAFDLAAAKPGCLMMLGTTIPNTVLNSEEQFARLEMFPMPPISPEGADHLVVSSNLAMLAIDSPENRRIIEAMASPTFLRAYVDVSPGFVPSDPTIDTTVDDPLYLQSQPRPLHAREIAIAQTATREGHLVFTPSALLPLEAIRTLWTAPVQWYRSGGQLLDPVLEKIDAAVAAAER